VLVPSAPPSNDQFPRAPEPTSLEPGKSFKQHPVAFVALESAYGQQNAIAGTNAELKSGTSWIAGSSGHPVRHDGKSRLVEAQLSRELALRRMRHHDRMVGIPYRPSQGDPTTKSFADGEPSMHRDHLREAEQSR
jgi:hypothetical protein